MSTNEKDYYYLLEKGVDRISKEFFDENIILRRKLYGRKIKIHDKNLYEFYFERLSQKYNQKELDYIMLLLREDRDKYQGNWNRLISVMAIFLTFFIGIISVISTLNLKDYFGEYIFILVRISFCVSSIVILVYSFITESKYVSHISRYDRMIEIIEFYNSFIKKP